MLPTLGNIAGDVLLVAMLNCAQLIFSYPVNPAFPVEIPESLTSHDQCLHFVESELSFFSCAKHGCADVPSAPKPVFNTSAASGAR